ncbi:zinc-binding dehydrogenase [Microbacterium sp.]|uniref:zinc-dependent alcohol dehydrogenase n=1 Tax=Microbacterium sp. TaxID=51671 RepID=UPI00356AE6E3
MRAARWMGRRQIELTEIPRPEPRADEALVRVTWVGLCGSDAEEYLHGPVQISGPVTLGHEIVGVVAEAAADGSGPSVGTPVVVDVVTGCGACYWCQRHQEGLCPALSVTGQHVDGGLAEYVVGRADRLIPVPEGMDPRHAALAEPLSVAVRAVRKAGPLPGMRVGVVGGGTVGMLTAQVARAAGAERVVVIEPAQSRRDLIAEFGCVPVWGASENERAEAIARESPGRGVDVVFECSGRPGMLREATRLVRRGGTVILLGIIAEDEPLDVLDLVLGEKAVLGSAAHMWDDDVSVAVGLLASGAVDVERMITHTFPLDQAEQAFAVLADPSVMTTKLLVEVGADRA